MYVVRTHNCMHVVCTQLCMDMERTQLYACGVNTNICLPCIHNCMHMVNNMPPHTNHANCSPSSSPIHTCCPTKAQLCTKVCTPYNKTHRPRHKIAPSAPTNTHLFASPSSQWTAFTQVSSNSSTSLCPVWPGTSAGTQLPS